MIDLFNLNLVHFPPIVGDLSSNAQLINSMHLLLHYLLHVHITRHMPNSGMLCLLCKNYTVDTFVQAVSNNCTGLKICGITERKVIDWYLRLSDPLAKSIATQSNGMRSGRRPLIDIVPKVRAHPEHLVTHLMWHEASHEEAWNQPGTPVRRGICTMEKLAQKLDLPILPSKTNFRDVETTLFIPANGDCAVPAYFFAYYVKSAWAHRLVGGAVAGTLKLDNFVKTAIMEELDIY